MMKSGGRQGRPLSARTCQQAHRVIKSALQRAVELELVARNAAAIGKSPTAERREIRILTPEEVRAVLEALRGHALFAIASLALATGLRLGELCGLKWRDVDFKASALRVERSLEQTRASLRLKSPKTKQGNRALSLPPSTIDMLRDHRRRQLEHRMGLGMGRPSADDLVFGTREGKPMSPNALSVRWRRLLVGKGLPQVRFHALRHTHASALIANGIDVMTISRRLGHASPSFTLSVYGHLFANTDDAAARAIEKLIG